MPTAAETGAQSHQQEPVKTALVGQGHAVVERTPAVSQVSLGAPGSSPAPEATRERDVPRHTARRHRKLHDPVVGVRMKSGVVFLILELLCGSSRRTQGGDRWPRAV
jgi:hypothetical protein